MSSAFAKCTNELAIPVDQIGERAVRRLVPDFFHANEFGSWRIAKAELAAERG
jgi:hypothetical protein